MPHTRLRHIAASIKKASSFWPVIALLGPRQVGKSTLLREQLQAGKYLSFDDQDVLDDANLSGKTFLQKIRRKNREENFKYSTKSN